ncbi:OadG family protein [Staphylococcus lentus]|uniref:OadG family protein n=1 Tax=Mammaliicoccus lentus TaxID=42858 RepID=UPI00188365FB|nr:OadG family protein [Mammaliicoccus lentus]MBF0840391.1 OadG family protein [Mammaliicoccus lentus]
MPKILEFLTEKIIGKPGNMILEMITNNYTTFLILIFIYGAILLYSKIIVRYYLPKKLKRFIENESRNYYNSNNIYEKWKIELERLPFYIIVPSKNELWVKKVHHNYKETKLLPYLNKEINLKSDKEIIKNSFYK